jgi:glycosyltransferase involved in cell wall biosynthesis
MGTKEVLDGGRGSLIAEDDEADFASKTVRLLADERLRKAASEQARVHAQSWSAPVLAQRMLDFYESVAARAADGSSEVSGGSAPSRRRNLGRAYLRGRQ